MSKYFVTGIGTDVGKTLVAAILVKKLQAKYWKPVQCGAPADTQTVKALTGLDDSHFLKEQLFLNEPASPHKAADLEGISITLQSFQLPEHDRLVVEGAGGLLVPINNTHTYLDLIKQLSIPVVVVSRHYLGSINHTLLTLKVLADCGVNVAGIVWNGNEDSYTESTILARYPHKVLGRVEEHGEFDGDLVDFYVGRFSV